MPREIIAFFVTLSITAVVCAVIAIVKQKKSKGCNCIKEAEKEF